jgi:hypothetical protein
MLAVYHVGYYGQRDGIAEHKSFKRISAVVDCHERAHNSGKRVCSGVQTND